MTVPLDTVRATVLSFLTKALMQVKLDPNPYMHAGTSLVWKLGHEDFEDFLSSDFEGLHQIKSIGLFVPVIENDAKNFIFVFQFGELLLNISTN